MRGDCNQRCNLVANAVKRAMLGSALVSLGRRVRLARVRTVQYAHGFVRSKEARLTTKTPPLPATRHHAYTARTRAQSNGALSGGGHVRSLSSPAGPRRTVRPRLRRLA